MTYTGTQSDLAAMFDFLEREARGAMDRATTKIAASAAKREAIAYADSAHIVRSWTLTGRPTAADYATPSEQSEQAAFIITNERELVEQMKIKGGSFAKNLAAAWQCADLGNRAKLRAAFSDLLYGYRQFL